MIIDNIRGYEKVVDCDGFTAEVEYMNKTHLETYYLLLESLEMLF